MLVRVWRRAQFAAGAVTGPLSFPPSPERRSHLVGDGLEDLVGVDLGVGAGRDGHLGAGHELFVVTSDRKIVFWMESKQREETR